MQKIRKDGVTELKQALLWHVGKMAFKCCCCCWDDYSNFTVMDGKEKMCQVLSWTRIRHNWQLILPIEQQMYLLQGIWIINFMVMQSKKRITTFNVPFFTEILNFKSLFFFISILKIFYRNILHVTCSKLTIETIEQRVKYVQS